MKSFRPLLKLSLTLTIALALADAAAFSARADELESWELASEAQVDSTGIFLDQLVSTIPAHTLPHLLVGASPSLGQTVVISRKQIIELVQKKSSELFTTNWSGATQIRVSRRTRQFTDSDLLELLTAALQKDFVKDRGTLELHLMRPWPKVNVPDETITLRVAELPATGFSPNFVVTCELWNGREHVGNYPVTVQAALWRDVPLAHSPLLRGQSLKDADISLERHDILVQRDFYLNYPPNDDSLELAENIAAGMPVYNRSVRVRPVIQRGRVVEGVFQDGTLSISLKVETLEDGLLGQTVRVRNPKTKRELYGKVQNDQTILIAL